MDSEALKILEELALRAEHDFHLYEPQQGQGEFHQSEAYIRLLFGGNQSGKSRGAAQEAAYWFTHNHPYRSIPDRPVKIWVISTEYQTIYEGVYRHLLRSVPEWHIAHKGPKVQGHNIQSYLLSSRGDEIKFLSAKGSDEARTKFQAAALDLVIIDEEIEEYIWDELQSRMISTGGCFVISATLVESYDWIVELEGLGEKGDPDVFLTRLRSDKNPYADTKHVNRLKRLWDEDTQRVRIYGKSARAQGLVYQGFKKSHRISPFTVPKQWPRYHAFDPGFRISAAIWGTVTPFGQVIVYREYYKSQAELHQVASEFNYIERDEYIDRLIIDDKSGSKTITGEPGPLTQMSMYHKRYYSPAIKFLHAGVEEVRNWLKITEAEGHYDYKLDDGSTLSLPSNHRFFVFDNCINFFKEISGYRFKSVKDKKDANEPVDQPVKRRDHLMDCLRYWLVLRPEYFIREEMIGQSEQGDWEEYIPHRTDMVSRIERHMERTRSENEFAEQSMGMEY